MICRACHSSALDPLPFAVPAPAGRWFRCRACGSDTAAHGYDPGIYTPDYYRTHAGTADPVYLREQVRSNCDWFGHHAGGLPNRDFLDVGCADGAGLDVMQSLGWAVHGFDVAPPPYLGPHVTVGAVFSRWLFPLRYAAVLCREVVEHVDCPDLLLHELHGVACPGGLVQVQTPRPLDRYDPDVQQRAHLCILSPDRLGALLNGAMLDVIDAREWEMGQAYLCRARR
ncbi:MAG TPA: methyltransferase domain-containing protein [Urbifossiella sp.]|nr:methyltransferase domain-containing protein [Urbifossiella sp.]